MNKIWIWIILAILTMILGIFIYYQALQPAPHPIEEIIAAEPILNPPTIYDPITVQDRILLNEGESFSTFMGIFNPLNKTINAKIQGGPECVPRNGSSTIQIDSLTTSIQPYSWEAVKVQITPRTTEGRFICLLAVYDEDVEVSSMQIQVDIRKKE